MKKYDLLIVGGGVLGTFHAYHALEQGLSVALVDKNARPQGSSVQNFGQVVPSGMNSLWQQYGRKSLEIYQSIQAKFDISVRQNGSVYLASNAAEWQLLEELAEINRANDYTSELLSPAQCTARYEGLNKDYCIGGLFFPQEITVEPRVAVSRIQAYLTEQKELDFFPKTLITSTETVGEGVEVRSSDGRVFHAEQVLICSGYEFQTLYPEIFAASDLQAVKLQMLLTVPQRTQKIPGSVLTGWSIRRYESFSECPSWAAIKAEEKQDTLAQKWGVHILFKQALDGTVIIGDSHEYADAGVAETLGNTINHDMNRFMLEEAAKIFDLQDYTLQESWFGTYSQCKNNDIFRHTIDSRIHILTGIGGKGMTGSAGYAEMHLQDILAL